MQIIKRTIPLNNYMVGREGKPVTKIVIHWFGIGDLAGADSRFSNPLSNVSAHYGISNDIVYQWVEEKDTSYGAGDWNTNLTCINIEHDATTIKNATEETYKTAGQLVKEICARHNIPIDREHILKHSQVKPTQCPGTLDIDKIISYAKGESMSLSEDIGSLVEEQFKLKEVPRYSKYWSYEELINDWVKMYKELVYNTTERDRFKKEVVTLTEQVEKAAEVVCDLNKDIAELDKKLASRNSEISQLQSTIATISKDNIELAEQNKAILFRIEKLEADNKDLLEKIGSSQPLKVYTSKELLVEVIDRIFKRG